MKKIMYITYLSKPVSQLGFDCVTSPASEYKSQYIRYCYKLKGYDVTTFCIPFIKTSSFSNSVVTSDECGKIYIPIGIGKLYLRLLIANFIFFIKGVFNSGEIVFYNSPQLYFAACILSMFKKKFTLQLEELYSEKTKNSFLKWMISLFESCLIRNSNKIITCSYSLQDKCKTISNCSEIICVHGAYFLNSSDSDAIYSKGKNFVFSGSIDKERGVFPIVSWFINNFSNDKSIELHITGTGSNFFLKKLKSLICGYSNIYYHGLLSESELKKLYSKCKYGLVYQHPEDCFTNASFPSKIPFYFSYGLSVICQSNMVSVEKSDFSEYVNFIDFHSNSKLKENKIIEFDSLGIIDKLHNGFLSKI